MQPLCLTESRIHEPDKLSLNFSTWVDKLEWLNCINFLFSDTMIYGYADNCYDADSFDRSGIHGFFSYPIKVFLWDDNAKTTCFTT